MSGIVSAEDGNVADYFYAVNAIYQGCPPLGNGRRLAVVRAGAGILLQE